MLDVALELEKFRPINLEEVEEQAGKLPEDTVEAIHLFNKALEDVHSRNEDMAIIALKKSISLYPSFYEAMNLLGICLYAVGKEEAAQSAFRQVIDTDDNGIKALQYLDKLNSTDEENESNANAVKKKKNKKNKNVHTSKDEGLFSQWLAKGLQSEDNSLYGLKYILGILIGILMTGFVWYMVPTNKSLLSFEKVENITKDPELLVQIDQLNERIEKLEQELDERKEENFKLMDSFQTYKDWVSRMDQAEAELLRENYIQSAELLLGQQGMAISDDLKSRYEQLWEKVRPKAAEQYYKDGNRLYNGNTGRNSNIYRQALEQYETALTFLENDKVSYHAALYYQAGKAAARCDEMEKAVALFETLVDDFSSSSYGSYAAARLREIERGESISGN